MLNVKLLRRVARHIEAEPARLRMRVWAQKSSRAPCGTAACIAGWALILNAPPLARRRMLKARDAERAIDDLAGDQGVQVAAALLLGLQRPNDPLGFRVFLHSCWPEPFRTQFISRRASVAKRAETAAARIRHLIKTGE